MSVENPQEAVKAAVAEIRTELDKNSAELRSEISKNLDTQLKDLETKIKNGELEGKGVAELKEESANRSKENAKIVEKIEAMVKSHSDTLNERLEAIEKAGPTVGKGRPNVVDYGAGISKEVQAMKMKSSTPGKAAYFKFDGMFPHALASSIHQKMINVTGATVYEPQYVPGIIGPGERQMRVRDLIPRNRTSANTIYFLKEVSLTDGAAPQSALGATKGETSFNVSPASEAVKTLAHFSEVPLQMLDDIPGMEDYINGRMLFLLEQEEEDQLLYGTGIGQNLNGLMTQATPFDTTLLTELSIDTPSDIDLLRMAIAQVQVAEYPPTGIIMHTYNWAGIETRKDSQKRYIFAMPQDRTVPRMWGLPVIATTAMQSPDFLVGAFQLGAAIWDRMESQIAISTEDSTNFRDNKATVRAEERIAQTVYRPLSFVQGDFALTVT